MARGETVILTNMCMIENALGEVVVQIRDPKRYAWSGAVFPGGHIEEHESLQEAVIREVYEETGLMIKDPTLLGVKHFHTRDDGIRYLVFLYKASDFSGELVSSEEGEVRWVSRMELVNGVMELADSMSDMLPIFFGEESGELFYKRDANNNLQRWYL